jgi:hypothetical protein
MVNVDITLFSAFIVGLFSTLHCLGMCGGIIGALTFSLPTEVRNQRWRLVSYIAAYNTGRIVSYALAGAVAGGLGSTLFSLLSPGYGHMLLLAFASLIMAGIGMYLAGWFPRFALIEHLGRPLWRYLEPVGQKLLPVRSPLQAFLFGIVWGWLPCGLVYSALIWSSSAGGAMQGALFMLFFGAGTLPSVMTAGIITGWMTRLSRLPGLRVAVGVSLILMALFSLYLNLEHIDHTQHQHHKVNPTAPTP